MATQPKPTTRLGIIPYNLRGFWNSLTLAQCDSVDCDYITPRTGTILKWYRVPCPKCGRAFLIDGRDLAIFPLVSLLVLITTILSLIWPFKTELLSASVDGHRLKQGNAELGITLRDQNGRTIKSDRS